MSCLRGKVHQVSSSDDLGRCARQADAGVARGPGLLVAGVTAAIVFAVGQHLFPIKQREPARPTAPAVSETAPQTPSLAADAASTPQATAGSDASATTAKVIDASAAVAAADAGAARAPKQAA